MSSVCDNVKNHNKTIVLFTSNFRGGIIQFTMQLYLTIELLGYKAIVYMPENASINNSYSILKGIQKYPRQKTIKFRSKLSREIAKSIENLNPILILFCDTSIISMQVLLSIKKDIIKAAYMHDIIPHPGRFSLYIYFKEILNKKIFVEAVKTVNKIILLSENSYNLFKTKYNNYSNKAIRMPLGAHIPEVEPFKPLELGESISNGYYLFFGRICEYKGIIHLLNAYTAITTEQKPLLIIAGSGELQAEEKDIIEKNSNIVLINRYIEDGEMLYLVNNSLTVVLPYIEASQSGLIPIAYHCGIPVITSNVAGLVEFVEDNVSGIICSNVKEMTAALLKICDKTFYKHLSEGAQRLYKDRLNWDTNLKACIESLLQ